MVVEIIMDIHSPEIEKSLKRVRVKKLQFYFLCAHTCGTRTAELLRISTFVLHVQ